MRKSRTRMGSGVRFGGGGLVLAGLLGSLAAPQAVMAQAQTQVDSTRLRIIQRLEGLARPPGIDSTYFLPDSLLPDSILELREAQDPRSGRASGRQPRPGLQRPHRSRTTWKRRPTA